MRPPHSGVTTTPARESSSSERIDSAGQEHRSQWRRRIGQRTHTDSWQVYFTAMRERSKTTQLPTATLDAIIRWAGRHFGPIRRAFGDSPITTGLSLAFLLLLGMLLVRPMVMSMMSYQRTAALLEERRDEVASLRDRNERLTATQEYYRTNAFVAERAREYGLVRPGESPFVVREYAHPESAGAFTRNKVQNQVFGGPELE